MQPTRRALLLFTAGLPLALLPAALDARLWPVWLAFNAFALAAVGADALLSLPRRRLRVRPEVPALLYAGAPLPLRIELEAPGWPRAVRLELLTELGERLVPQPQVQVVVPPGAARAEEVPLVARRRGLGEVIAVWLRWSGPLGLVRRTVRHGVRAEVPVVPDVRAVRAAAMNLMRSRSYLVGLRPQHYLGDGSEFDELREYAPGLDHRAMDWKRSARHLTLLCRQHRAERNHSVVLAFDTGHLMSEPLAGLPRLDHAINAGLLLAYYGLKAGDRVGLFAFDERPRLFVAPQAGVRSFARLQHRTALIDYTVAEANFTLGLSELGARLDRRSLVVVLTDFVDTVTAELMVENLGRLARRHRVVFVSLRDPGTAALVESRPRSVLDVGAVVVAGELLRERERVLLALARRGVSCIDASPGDLSTRLLNRYLEIKRREQIA